MAEINLGGDAMEYVNFGAAGVKVSRLTLGMGLRGEGHDAGARERLVHRAIERGVNLFDCANVYWSRGAGGYVGRAEEILGRALRGRRDDVVITSKVVSQIGPGPNDRGASRYHIMREVERSLRRLGTDRIDVYLLHSFDAGTPLEEQLRALDDLVRQGKVRYVGVSNFQAWQVCRALWVQDRLNAAPLIAVQHPYNLLNRALEQEMFPLVRAMGLGVMVYAPLATGLLSGVYALGAEAPAGTFWGEERRGHAERLLSGQAGEALGLVREIAARAGATVAQVALAWILTHPEITTLISGADTEAQLEENLGALQLELSPDDLEQLDRASAGLALRFDGPEFPSRPANPPPTASTVTR